MSARTKRPPKTRTSKKFCVEKFACAGENAEAEYECEQCGSFQCSNCERMIHEKSTKYVIHDRIRVRDPPAENLCQMSCEDKNFADVRCENCAMTFCNACNEKVHSQGRRKSHKRIPYKSVGLNSSVLNDTITVDYPPIKPSSPIGGDDDSMTFFTMPQTDNFAISEAAMEDDHFSSLISNNSKKNQAPLCTQNIPDVAASIGSELDALELNEVDPPHNHLASPSMPIEQKQSEQSLNDAVFGQCSSFLLADQNENLKISSADEFLRKLSIDSDQSVVKVVSIFGNTGDGKSYTLNHTFFSGKEIFKTSPTQLSCTIGVWAAYDPVHNAIIIDTEGLLGVSTNHNQRTRLLLKVLAISDVVIYRSKADRLHNDLFSFLSDASKAYVKHFSEELKVASKRMHLQMPLSTLGPAVIIFHETQHTEILGTDINEPAEKFIRNRFQGLELSIDAFSDLVYVGTRTQTHPTNFKGLLLAVKSQLKNTTIRAPRKPEVIFQALRVLNDKFVGDIEKTLPSTFPDQYFTCSLTCLSCNSRCTQTMGHLDGDDPHKAENRCRYQHQYDNRIFICKGCHERGREMIVVPKTSASTDSSWLGLAKYAWSGYVLECPNCGVIYRSRQYWYGNEDPMKGVVRTEIRHVWPDGNPVLQGTHNAARRVLDGIHYMSDTLASVSAKPAKAVSRWVTDQIAPPYWVPNSQIFHCRSCKTVFDELNQIHHCRSCGHGFCDDCSSKLRPVPERGWGSQPVRVCDPCFDKTDDAVMTDSGAGISPYDDTSQLMPRKVGEAITTTAGVVATAFNYPMVEAEPDANSGENNLQARKVTEAIGSTFGLVKNAIDVPLDMLRDSARPAYWVADHEIKCCCVCKAEFGPKLNIHHCRACGQGVCSECSPARRPVPSRGWDHDVRVCNSCDKRGKKL